MHLPNIPPTKRCGQCANFKRAPLAGYGYCDSAIEIIRRARLLHRDTVCLFTTDDWSRHS